MNSELRNYGRPIIFTVQNRKGRTMRLRDYINRVFEGIQKTFPDLWSQGRLVRIPGGELFFELDKKMQAGEMPGIATIKDFYTDVQHIRAGLAGTREFHAGAQLSEILGFAVGAAGELRLGQGDYRTHTV
jgi:hypothetical protein